MIACNGRSIKELLCVIICCNLINIDGQLSMDNDRGQLHSPTLIDRTMIKTCPLYRSIQLRSFWHVRIKKTSDTTPLPTVSGFKPTSFDTVTLFPRQAILTIKNPLKENSSTKKYSILLDWTKISNL